MGKAKTNPVADNTAAGSPATTAVETQQTVETVETQQPETETNQAPEPADLNTVVVMCYKGTVEVMKKIWKKHLPEEVKVIFKEVTEAERLSQTVALVNLIADPEIPAGFIFVPANVIPCSYVDIASLMTPVVYVKKTGARAYNSNLPMFIDKENLIETIDKLETSGKFNKDTQPGLDADELLIKTYLEDCAVRAVEVSHNFGNYVTLVARANPCVHTVIEGFLRKKFVTVTDPAGFAAITPELVKAYSLDTDNE